MRNVLNDVRILSSVVFEVSGIDAINTVVCAMYLSSFSIVLVD